jgi:hypothetical protein
VASPTDAIRVEWSLDYTSPDPPLSTAEAHDPEALVAVLDSIERDASEPVIAELVNRRGARLGLDWPGPAASYHSTNPRIHRTS